MSEPKEMTVAQLAANLGTAFQMAEIDPAKDTIMTAIEKFRKIEASQLTLYIEDGGFFCLCADRITSRKFREAVDAIHEELSDEFIQARFS